MKRNQNLPNRHITLNNMTGKPLPFSHRSRSNTREQRNHSKHRIQINTHKVTQNPIMGIVISNHRVEMVHNTQDKIHKIIHNKILEHNHITIIETEIVHDDRFHEIDSVMFETILIDC